MLSHGNVSTNVLQAEAWLGKRFRDEPAVLITAIPLYHIFALSANCMLFARLGWKNVLIINPRDLPALIADMRKYPCTFISGVNTLFNALLHAPGFDKLDFSRLKVTLGGGMAVQATVAQRWKEERDAYAFFAVRDFDRLRNDLGVPMQEVARGPRYVIVRKP